MRLTSTLIAVLMASAASGVALAADGQYDAYKVDVAGQDALAPSRFYVHVGPAALIMNEGATFKVAGNKVPGADISIDPNVTAAVEIGYYIDRHIAVSFTGGYPPTATVIGAGSLTGLGTLGKATYGPTTLTAHYHFTDFGRFQPYVGAGPVFMFVFDNQDGVVTHLDTNASIGVALQAGAEFAIDRRWGAFFDVKKAFLKTEATGDFGPAPVRANIRLDPLVLSGGLSYRF